VNTPTKPISLPTPAPPPPGIAASVEPIAEIALLTDGLQGLALHYQPQAHAPSSARCFCGPARGLRARLSGRLQTRWTFSLDAPVVNSAATHDDKP